MHEHSGQRLTDQLTRKLQHQLLLGRQAEGFPLFSFFLGRLDHLDGSRRRNEAPRARVDRHHRQTNGTDRSLHSSVAPIIEIFADSASPPILGGVALFLLWALGPIRRMYWPILGTSAQPPRHTGPMIQADQQRCETGQKTVRKRGDSEKDGKQPNVGEQAF